MNPGKSNRTPQVSENDSRNLFLCPQHWHFLIPWCPSTAPLFGIEASAGTLPSTLSPVLEWTPGQKMESQLSMCLDSLSLLCFLCPCLEEFSSLPLWTQDSLELMILLPLGFLFLCFFCVEEEVVAGSLSICGPLRIKHEFVNRVGTRTVFLKWSDRGGNVKYA